MASKKDTEKTEVTFEGVKLKSGETVTQDTVDELTNGKGDDDE